jgi:hypothetical protein
MTGAQRGQQEPQHYEVRVHGHLGATMLRAFPALREPPQHKQRVFGKSVTAVRYLLNRGHALIPGHAAKGAKHKGEPRVRDSQFVLYCL